MSSPGMIAVLFGAMKLAVQLARSTAVRFVRLLRCFEITQVMIPAIRHDRRNPLAASPIKGNAFIATAIILVSSTITHVLRAGTAAQIAATIIQAIAVNVVNVLARLRANDQAMHPKPLPVDPSHGINGVGSGRALNAPGVRRHKRQIGGVDYRHFATSADANFQGVM